MTLGDADDEFVEITPTYDIGDQIIYFRIPMGKLPTSEYRLSLSGAADDGIHDLSGLIFDGDEDGKAGGDFRQASRFNDSTVTILLTGDLSRYVDQGSGNVRAKIRFQSVNPRQVFTANIDTIVWNIAG